MDHSNATTGRSLTAHRAVRGVLACVALVALAALFHSVRAHEGSSVQPTTFVDRALGATERRRSLERRTRSGRHARASTAAASTRTSARRRSRSRSHGTGSEHVAALRAAASRAPRASGSESILFGINRAEQFLTVERRQGTRTWSWQLDATHGTPHIDADGGISFSRAGRLAGFHILPVAILDRSGRDITPAGSRWSLDAQHARLDTRPATRRHEAAAPVPDRSDRADRGLRARRPVPAARRAAPRHVDRHVEPRHHEAVGSGRSATCWSRSSPSARPARSRRRPAGARSARRRRTPPAPIEQAVFWHLVDGTESSPLTFSWAGGNADASGGLVTYKGVDPFIGFDQGGSAATSMASGGHRRNRQPGRPRGHDHGGERDAAGRLRRRERRHRHADRRARVSCASGPSPRPAATKVTAGFADGVQAAAGASGNKTATWVTSSLWVAHLFALKNEAADGSGTVAASFTTASASQSGTDADADLHAGRREHGERRRLGRRSRRLDGAAVDDAECRRLRDGDGRQRRRTRSP